MSLIAGVISLNGSKLRDENVCDFIKSNISRNPIDQIVECITPHAYIAKVDIDAYKASGYLKNKAKSVIMLAGDPSIPNDNIYSTRTDDLQTIQNDLDASNENISSLKQATGVFSIVYLNKNTNSVIIATDKLGIRPIYYYVSEDFLIFSSTLRLLEKCPYIKKNIDIRGIIEEASMGYALADRTPYQEIKRLPAGQLLQVKKRALFVNEYWRWDDLKPFESFDINKFKEGLLERFDVAMVRRLRADRNAISFLTGGLDSRCIVGLLHKKLESLYTYNISNTGIESYDKVLSHKFSQVIGAQHQDIIIPRDEKIQYSKLIADAISQSKWERNLVPEHQALVWSGDGGSVGFGHVYLDATLVEAMRENKTKQAILYYLKSQNISVPKIVNKEIAGQLTEEIPYIGIQEEIEKIHYSEAGRKFYLFLMINEQRHHLDDRYENIDLHRIEYHLPFFDSAYLELIIRSPIELCLDHELYSEWLELFPPEVTSTPWQTYPGHKKCPLQLPKDIVYQWSQNPGVKNKAEAETVYCRFKKFISAPDFPSLFINLRKLKVACLLHKMKVRNYSYLVGYLETINKFYQNSRET